MLRQMLSSGPSSTLGKLAKAISGVNQATGARPAPPLSLTRATVTAINVPDANGNTVTTVQLAGSAKSIPADLVVGYDAKVGDNVEALIAPPRVVVLGSTKITATPNAYGIPFTLAGALSASTSPPVTPRASLSVTGFSVTLGTAGTSNTVVALLKNGNSIGSVTLGSGVTYAHTSFKAVTFTSRVDEYSISVTTAGSGAANLGGEIEVN